jgi:carboxyl-terminal processing protease
VLQQLIPLDDGAALILTIAKYYSPDGQAIQDHAVTPSIEVTLAERQPEAPSHAMPPPGDPVLLKALEVLRGQTVTTQARKSS